MNILRRCADMLHGACKWLYALYATQGKSSQEIEEFQYNELRKLVVFAWNNIPFYNQYWGEHGFDPSQLCKLEDFSRIPCIDKDIVRESYEQMIPRGYDKRSLKLITTGGTTGLPLSFYANIDQTNGRELLYQIWSAYRSCGYKKWIDNVVLLRGERLDPSLINQGIYWKRYFGKLGRGVSFSSFHLTEETYEVYIKKILEVAPCFIVAYPSSLTVLCTLMKKKGTRPWERLRGVICSSEMVYEWQRKLVKEVLGVEIYSCYGHTEKAIVANPDRMHRFLFEPSYGYVEFLDEQLAPVTERGAIAQIIATSFQNYYMPFIRYKTSDYVYVGDTPPVGYTHVAEDIVGRKQDFVYDDRGNAIPFTCSDEVFWDVSGIVAYQYVQKKEGNITIHLEVDNSFDQQECQRIKLRVEEMFSNCLASVVVVDHISRTSSGKFRYFIQEMTR